MSRLDAIIKQATDARVRLLVEVDPKGKYKVWHDSEESRLVRTWFRGATYRSIPVPTFIKFPPVPTVQKTPYKFDEETIPMIKYPRRIDQYGNTTVFGEHEEKPPRLRLTNAPLDGQIQRLENKLNGKYTVNIARNDIYLYPKGE